MNLVSAAQVPSLGRSTGFVAPGSMGLEGCWGSLPLGPAGGQVGPVKV